MKKFCWNNVEKRAALRNCRVRAWTFVIQILTVSRKSMFDINKIFRFSVDGSETWNLDTKFFILSFTSMVAIQDIICTNCFYLWLREWGNWFVLECWGKSPLQHHSVSDSTSKEHGSPSCFSLLQRYLPYLPWSYRECFDWLSCCSLCFEGGSLSPMKSSTRSEGRKVKPKN